MFSIIKKGSERELRPKMKEIAFHPPVFLLQLVVRGSDSLDSRDGFGVSISPPIHDLGRKLEEYHDFELWTIW